MISLYRVLRELWLTPAAEVDPEEWATRFAAHMGLSAGVTIALLALLPAALALAVSLLGYAAWELSQWRRGRGWLLAADCVLDWCAWATIAFAIWYLSISHVGTAALLVLAALVICGVGVWRRS